MRDPADIIRKYHEVIARINRTDYAPIIAIEGRGAIVKDITGREYIDLSASAAVMTLGYGAREVAEAVCEAARRITHYTHMYGYVPEALELAEELLTISPIRNAKVSYGLTGNDANEGALLLARAYTGADAFIAFENSFHGVGAAATSVSGIGLAREVEARIGEWARTYFVPYPNCYHSPYPGDEWRCSKYYIEELRRAIEEHRGEIAAIVFEPILGDGGIVVPPDPYVRWLGEIAREEGILLIDDEVQTAIGRTGKWFAIQHYGITPDLIPLGKPLGGGIPISALIGRADVMESLPDMAYTFTLAGNPVSCAAALAVIRAVREKGLLKRAEELGRRAMDYLRREAEKHDLIGDVRGKGLMIGVELVKDKESKEPALKEARKVVWRAYELGVIILFVAGNVLRIQPPLTIDEETLDEGLERLTQAITDVEEGRVSDEALKAVKGW